MLTGTPRRVVMALKCAEIPVIPVAAGQLTRQEEHKAALLRNAQIREHYKFEEIVDMENKHDLKFFECALWAIPVCAIAWAVIIWALYKLFTNNTN